MKVLSTTWLRRSLGALGIVLVVCAETAAAGQARPLFQGRTLVDVLRSLQREGLHIVFSSETITPDMRVAAEPRARGLFEQLDELLAPHGLKAERGPHSIIEIVRRRSADPAPRRIAPRAPARSEAVESGGGRFAEEVIVRAPASERDARTGLSQGTLDAEALQAGRSVLHDDPLQAVQALPGVAAADDFRSELSVRGSPYRHIGVVVDGVATPWLRHAVYGRSDAGSLTMFGTDSIEQATLQAGAYPRRHDDKLGAQLELTLRQGSRESTRVQASAGGTLAGVVAEGPLGRQKRGSWIVSARNSYLTWPVRRHTDDGVAFGSGDAHAKLVYDVTPAQQVTFAAVGGRSALDWKTEPVGATLVDGSNRAALASVGWRILAGERTVIRQQASMAGRTFLNKLSTGQEAGAGADRALSYQGAIFRALFAGTLEAGGEVRHAQGSRRLRIDGPLPGAFDAAWSTRSAYAHFARDIGKRLSIAEGIRVSHSTLVHAHTVSPWILAAWSFAPGWRVNASAGVFHQFPELEEMWGASGMPLLAPERATSAGLGVEQRVAGGFRWQATVFNRIERNVLRAADGARRLLDAVVLDPAASRRYENALNGTARGVDLLVARERAGRLTGWLSYTYATMRQTDIVRQETFWGDFDRRHTFNAAGVYRGSPRSSLGLVLRGGTNLPIAGYFEARGGALFLGERRNEIRLPFYARLDARGQRTFIVGRGRMTAFAEVLNVLNRSNAGGTDGQIDPATGEASGFVRALVGRRASVGITVDFGSHDVPPRE